MTITRNANCEPWPHDRPPRRPRPRWSGPRRSTSPGASHWDLVHVATAPSCPSSADASEAGLAIDSRVLVDGSRQPLRHALSHPIVSALARPQAWLNQRIFVGTLKTLRPQRQPVLVRAYLCDG